MSDNSDLIQAVMHLTADVAEMRAEMRALPRELAGKAVELLFDQLRDLDEAGFYKLKLAARVFGNGHKVV
jgi:hypothetical protein